MTEEWLPVVGWEESYEVSDMGNVRSISRTIVGKDGVAKPFTGSTVTPVVTPKGYLQVRLWKYNKPNSIYVHKLVLEAFVGKRPEEYACRHLNGVPADNRLVNIEWNTQSVNQKDKVKHGTHNQSRKTHCPRGHILKLPNLRPDQLRKGKRTCKTCHRMNDVKRRSGTPCSESKEQEIYERIMKEGT